MPEVVTTSNRFKFNVPLELLKADDNGWSVSGLASTEDKDLQGEIVKQDGLDISALKQGRGLLNYEHRNNPEDIVGCIEDADMKSNGLWIKGYLFKKHKRAQAIAEIMQSLGENHKKRIQLSIEGKVQERGIQNEKIIKRAMVDRVAITFEPVNTNTYLAFAKSLTAALPSDVVAVDPTINGVDPKDIVDIVDLDAAKLEINTPEAVVESITPSEEVVAKTIVASGGDAAPASLSGGAALTQESVNAEVINIKDSPKKKKKYDDNTKKAILKSVLDRILKQFPDVTCEQIQPLIRDIVAQRFE